MSNDLVFRFKSLIVVIEYNDIDKVGGALWRARYIFVSQEYVRFLDVVANEKLEANRRRTEGFLQVLMCSMRMRITWKRRKHRLTILRGL